MSAMQAAQDALKRLDPYPEAKEKAFDRIVRIVVRDGTEFLFVEAAALTWRNPQDRRRWLLIWTARYGYHAFSLEELKYYGCYVQDKFLDLDEVVR